MMFATYKEERNYRFYEDWLSFWLPIYRKQVLNAKMDENQEALKEIKINILKNECLADYKDFIFEKLGINYLQITPNNDEQIKEKLFLKNEKLIYLALKKKGLLHNREEFYDIGLIGLTNTINTYDSSKGIKESTYFYKCISNEINKHIYLQNLPKRKCPTSIISLDYQLEEESKTTYVDLIPDPNVNIEEETIIVERNRRLIDAINKLKPDYQKIIKKHYGFYEKKKTFREISEEEGVSDSAIQDKEKRALKQLKILLEKEDL